MLSHDGNDAMPAGVNELLRPAPLGPVMVRMVHDHCGTGNACPFLLQCLTAVLVPSWTDREHLSV